jgi:thioredoxin-related protein
MMKMKKWMLVLLLVGAVMHAQEWRTDLNAAIAEAARTDKNVLLLFSLPDACDVCETLEKNVIRSQEFKTFAAENYVLARPDFSESADMMTKADNLLIVEKYNKDGFFPWVVILDKNAKVLAKMGQYNDETPEAYITKLQSLTRR